MTSVYNISTGSQRFGGVFTQSEQNQPTELRGNQILFHPLLLENYFSLQALRLPGAVQSQQFVHLLRVPPLPLILRLT